jgi:hypothetical protein
MTHSAGRERRQIRCTECGSLFWLDYTYAEPHPLAAAGVLCPEASCRKLNPTHLPASAHAFEVSHEMPALDVLRPTVGDAAVPQGEEPAKTGETVRQPSHAYWRPASL